MDASRRLLLTALAAAAGGCTVGPPSRRGPGDEGSPGIGRAASGTSSSAGARVGVVIERADGSVRLFDTRTRAWLARIEGLGDLSHASLVFSRDARHAYVFGRDGGLSRIDLAGRRMTGRILQAGNAIGGAISKDGRVLAVANYEPGGVRLFDADTLEPLAEIAASYGREGRRSKVVGIADAPGNRFVFSLFDADAIWVADVTDPRRPVVRKHEGIGRAPYDALILPDGRHYVAGLFGEDGLALLDLSDPDARVRRILSGYGQGQQRLPVYKMPHLRGWALAGERAFLPAIGRHEVLVVDRRDWRQVGTIPVQGQPVFVMARPDGRQVWVNFAHPTNDVVQVIDIDALRVTRTLSPGRAVMHMEFSADSGEVWVSARDDHRVVVFDTASLDRRAELDARSPSGIFMPWRAGVIGL